MKPPLRRRVLRGLLLAAGLLVGVPLALATGGIAALPVIADWIPLELSRVVVTDGRRQVEMQGMVHLARPDFYRTVAERVAQRRREGWLVFYEEVRPDEDAPAAGIADVLKRLGARWDADSRQHPYAMMADLIGDGLVLQDNRALLGPPGPDVRNVDVTLSQLLAALPPAPPGGAEPAVDLAETRRLYDRLPGWAQRRVQAAIRIALAVTATGDLAQEILPPAITTLREDIVTRAILAEPGRNILVLYGQAHIEALRRRLGDADPNWRLVSAQALRAF